MVISTKDGKKPYILTPWDIFSPKVGKKNFREKLTSSTGPRMQKMSVFEPFWWILVGKIQSCKTARMSVGLVREVKSVKKTCITEVLKSNWKALGQILSLIGFLL